ncbi:hypothetical protein IFM89_028711 [Coptis chinensis]|uniref:Uncharacterized protein n=1 Tax=Coptis chinensis TaxID=261450 RepID=A0A835LZZ8_9MAGN|nr:hypothetical protein IFM89_028711 [Coptis chinensis]
MANRFFSKSGSYLFKLQLQSTPSRFQNIKLCSKSKDRETHVQEKATSTAEEFSRLAQEKAESASQTAKETLKGAKEALFGESKAESAKEGYKKTVEKGNYDNKGKE